jgi:hypothetical protein
MLTPKIDFNLANSSHADLRLKSACYSYLEISKRLYGALTIYML